MGAGADDPRPSQRLPSYKTPRMNREIRADAGEYRHPPFRTPFVAARSTVSINKCLRFKCVSVQKDLEDKTIVVLSALAPPGPQFVMECVRRGARVIVFDRDKIGLSILSAKSPAEIEPMAYTGSGRDTFDLMSEVWGDEHVHMLLNLAPLDPDLDVSTQMRVLSGLLRALMRGLIAAQGSVVSVVARPADPLALVPLARCAATVAAGEALQEALSDHHVRVHTLTVDQKEPLQALDAIRVMAGPDGAPMLGHRIDLG